MKTQAYFRWFVKSEMIVTWRQNTQSAAAFLAPSATTRIQSGCKFRFPVLNFEMITALKTGASKFSQRSWPRCVTSLCWSHPRWTTDFSYTAEQRSGLTGHRWWYNAGCSYSKHAIYIKSVNYLLLIIHVSRKEMKVRVREALKLSFQHFVFYSFTVQTVRTKRTLRI
jgi:hypothetical protein